MTQAPMMMQNELMMRSSRIHWYWVGTMPKYLSAI
jgi:hypothetical protein